MFAERLIYLRERAGLTKKELADEIGIDKSTMTHYEKGDIKPSAKTIEKIADYFNVSTDYLLGKSDIIYMPKNNEENYKYFEVIKECVERGVTPEGLREMLENMDGIKDILDRIKKINSRHE